MNIKVTKLTDIDLLHKANEFTTGHESRMSLATAYRTRHTNIRTQIFWAECYGIPQYVAYHLRTHFSLYMMAPQEYGWMKSKRVDHGGKDFRNECEALVDTLETQVENMEESSFSYTRDAVVANIRDAIEIIREMPDHFDRYAHTDFCFMISAEGLMAMAATRLCAKASKETREVVQAICELVEEQDPDLYKHLVPQCIYRGGICPEPKGCGYIASEKGQSRLKFYKALFNQKNNSK